MYVSSHCRSWPRRALLLVLCWFLCGMFSPARGDVTITTDTTQSGGTLTVDPAGALIVDYATNPQLTLTDGATTTGVQAAIIGNTSSGELLINGGSQFLASGDGNVLGTYGTTQVRSGRTFLGLNAGSIGTATVDGAGTVLNSRMLVGYSGSGRLTVQNGGLVNSSYSYIGNKAGSVGTVIVDGPGSEWKLEDLSSQGLFVGLHGSAIFEAKNGGKLASRYVAIGSGSDTNSTMTVDGSGSTVDCFRLFVGYGGSGHGALNVLNGAKVSSSMAAALGSNDPKLPSQVTGSAIIDGIGSEWKINGLLSVGDSGTGSLTVQNGGKVSSVGGKLGVATSLSSNSIDSVVVSGLGSEWINSSSLEIGGISRSGSLTIRDGGRVTNGKCSVRSDYPLPSSILVSGGEWTNLANLELSGGNSNFANETLTIVNQGKVNVAGRLSLGLYTSITINDGTLNSQSLDTRYGTLKFNSGTLHVSGAVTLPTGATFTVPGGGTYVNDGTVNVPVVVAGGGKVQGHGAFGGLTIQPGGTASPGNSPGTMTDASTTLSGGGAFLCEINALAADGGVAGSGTGWDLWNLGELTVNASNANPFLIKLASLSIANDAGALLNWNPAQSQQWLIATATNSGGIFDSVLSSFAIDASLFAQYNSLGGQFNLLAGNNGSQLLLTYTAVPEPQSLALLALGLVGIVGMARRPRLAGLKKALASGLRRSKALSMLLALVVLLGLTSAARGDVTITTDTTQSGGTLTVNPAGALIVDYATDPQLTLTDGATTTGVRATIVGKFASGELLIGGGSSLTTTGNDSALGISIPVVRSGNSYLGMSAGSNGTAVVDGLGSTWTNSLSVYVGNSGNGTLNIKNAGTVSDTDGYLGYNTNSSGTATIDGPGSSWNHSKGLSVGYSGSGTLMVQNGGQVTCTNGYVGYQYFNGTAAATIDGPGSAWNCSNQLSVGKGTLHIQNGSAVSAVNANIDHSGSVTIDGSGSELISSSASGLQVIGGVTLQNGGKLTSPIIHLMGSDGQNGGLTIDGPAAQLNTPGVEVCGALRVQNGAKVSLVYCDIGEDRYSSFSASPGRVTVDGPGSEFRLTGAGLNLLIGSDATGEMNVLNGGKVFSDGCIIGTLNPTFPPPSTTKISGADSEWNNDSFLIVGGLLRAGSLLIENGGRVTNERCTVSSPSHGASSTITVNGGEWTNRENLYIGGETSSQLGSGNVSILDAGKVNVAGLTKIWGVPGLVGAGGTLTIDGGTLNTQSLDASLGVLNFNSGTLHVSNAMTLPTGATFTVPGGGTYVNDGTVNVPVVVASGGKVQGHGAFGGLTIQPGGTASPGNSPGTMTDASTTLSGGGSYLCEINTLTTDGGVAGSPTGWDLWNLGELTVNASNANPFLIKLASLTSANDPGALFDWNPAQSQQWLIATATNSGGIFGSTLSSFAIDASLFAQYNTLGGQFSLLAGNNGSQLLLSYTAVPEPQSLALLALGLVGLIGMARRRQFR